MVIFMQGRSSSYTAIHANRYQPKKFTQTATADICFLSGKHIIVDRIVSDATSIFFIEANNRRRYCLKQWNVHKDVLRNASDNIRRIEYLLKGFAFNPRFAKNIYLCIADIQLEEGKEPEDAAFISVGKLIKKPEKSNLNPKKHYAVIMEYLPEGWHLDYQLRHYLGNVEGMSFLAREVAFMHRHLRVAPTKFQNIEIIRKKLDLNCALFRQGLDDSGLNNDQNIKLSELMNKAFHYCQPIFARRARQNHVRRCHGDLKVANLWVRTEPEKHLLALDCADFEPRFYYIDTLSDVAMLAVDIQAHLSVYRGEALAKQLTDKFLDTYLKETSDKREDANILLEYYMIEKAMICSYMWITFDKQLLDEQERSAWGKRYIDIARQRTARLEELLAVKLATSLPVEKTTIEILVERLVAKAFAEKSLAELVSSR